MRAGLPKKEPELVARWQEMDLYRRLREDAAGREKFVLHDGPPYANGNIHIGHALNKILKDVITRSFQMRGYDSNYVPGWDCHGLPIEWKIEEQYRAKGRDKDEVPVNEFRKECRDFAAHWIKVQTAEFKRLGIEGDFDKPYTTMNYHAEARIAGELLKFAESGQLYRGSKPVMWSVVERTALAEAEVEYQDYESDTIWVKFPVVDARKANQAYLRREKLKEDVVADLGMADDLPPKQFGPEEWARVTGAYLDDAYVVIWTTTPWTIPGNRAISFSSRIKYGLYEVTAAENDFGPQPGEKLVFADALAEESFAKAKLEYKPVRDVTADELASITCGHPLNGLAGGYEFDVPLIAGEHVTDDAGTGFVHTAPGHGREDFDAWTDNARALEARGISAAIPFTVDDAGYFTKDAPGFGPGRDSGPARVIDDKGKKGDANKAVIDGADRKGHAVRARPAQAHLSAFLALEKAGDLPQHAAMVRPYGQGPWRRHDAARRVRLKAIDETRFVPASGQTRLRGMIEDRPDWVLSRQRHGACRSAVFADDETAMCCRMTASTSAFSKPSSRGRRRLVRR
jgi:isoleucyl-tRNA synthetase